MLHAYYLKIRYNENVLYLMALDHVDKKKRRLLNSRGIKNKKYLIGFQ